MERQRSPYNGPQRKVLNAYGDWAPLNALTDLFNPGWLGQRNRFL